MARRLLVADAPAEWKPCYNEAMTLAVTPTENRFVTDTDWEGYLLNEHLGRAGELAMSRLVKSFRQALRKLALP